MKIAQIYLLLLSVSLFTFSCKEEKQIPQKTSTPLKEDAKIENTIPKKTTIPVKEKPNKPKTIKKKPSSAMDTLLPRNAR